MFGWQGGENVNLNLNVNENCSGSGSGSGSRGARNGPVRQQPRKAGERHTWVVILCPCMRANRDIPVKLTKVEYPAVTPGMQREQVKPLHAAYVRKGEGETEYHTKGRQGCCA